MGKEKTMATNSAVKSVLTVEPVLVKASNTNPHAFLDLLNRIGKLDSLILGHASKIDVSIGETTIGYIDFTTRNRDSEIRNVILEKVHPFEDVDEFLVILATLIEKGELLKNGYPNIFRLDVGEKDNQQELAVCVNWDDDERVWSFKAKAPKCITGRHGCRAFSRQPSYRSIKSFPLF